MKKYLGTIGLGRVEGVEILEKILEEILPAPLKEVEEEYVKAEENPIIDEYITNNDDVSTL